MRRPAWPGNAMNVRPSGALRSLVVRPASRDSTLDPRQAARRLGRSRRRRGALLPRQHRRDERDGDHRPQFRPVSPRSRALRSGRVRGRRSARAAARHPRQPAGARLDPPRRPQSRDRRTRCDGTTSPLPPPSTTPPSASDGVTTAMSSPRSATPHRRPPRRYRPATPGRLGFRRRGGVVAFAIAGASSDHGYLQRLAVEPGAQRRGHGRALTVDALRWMMRRRLPDCLVNTSVDNDAALGLYGSIGFRRMERTPHRPAVRLALAAMSRRRPRTPLLVLAAGALVAVLSSSPVEGRAPRTADAAGTLTIEEQNYAVTPGEPFTASVTVAGVDDRRRTSAPSSS